MRRILVALLAAVGAACCPALAQDTYTPVTVAGLGIMAWGGDGRTATAVDLFGPQRAAVDRSGNVYFTDSYYGRLLKLGTNGLLTTAAGGGTADWTGTSASVPATSLAFDDVEGVAIDASGNVYLGADQRIWKIASDGSIRPVAGTGDYGYSGDNGPALSATLSTPYALAVDSAGGIYLLDNDHDVVRRVTASGTISTVAGTGDTGYSGDGQLATAARLSNPHAIALDGAGNLYIADAGNYRIRRVNAAGYIATVAGNGSITSGLGEGVNALYAALYPIYALAMDSSGNLYFSGSRSNEIHRLDTTSGLIYSVSGNVLASDDLAIYPTGQLAAVDQLMRGVYRVTLPDGNASMVAGRVRSSAIGDGSAATSALLLDPSGLTLDAAGNLWIADWDDQRIRKVDTTGKITTAVGTGIFGWTNEGTAATAVRIAQPRALALSSSGVLYFNSSCRIMSVGANGNVQTVAGNGSCGYSNPPGAASAMLNFPGGLAVTDAGDIYIADTDNHRIRRATSGGTIQTIAGSGQQGYSGNNGSDPLAASLDTPMGIAVDSKGSVYFADSGNNRVRRITSGGIYDVAGNGRSGNEGDGGAATAASLCAPRGIAFDASDNLYITSCGYIRKVSGGKISTIAGNGDYNFSGDGGPATSAGMDPCAIAVDAKGKVYFTDAANGRVRRLDAMQQSQPPTNSVTAVVNGATFLSGAVAPGEIVTVYGSGIGPAQIAVATLDPSGPPLAATLGGVQITFDGVAAPLIYVSATQAGVIVPFAVAGKSSTAVQATYNKQTTAAFNVPVAAASPGLFTANSSGKGQAALLNQDGSVNSSSKPAAAGDVVMLFGTGGGQTSPASTDGRFTSAIDNLALPVSVSIGGLPATVWYSGSAPGMVAGVVQINVQIPAGVAAGDVPVVVTVGGVSSPSGVTLAVR